MALTRKFLTALGIEADKVDEIITAHTEVTDALKAERDQYKKDAEELPKVQKQLQDALEKGDDAYKAKYEKEHKDFEDYKKAKDAEDVQRKKRSVYKELLKEAGVSDKRIDSVLKLSGDVIDKIELDENGKAKDADELKKAAAKEWEDFIVKQETHGTGTQSHEGSGGGGMTKEDIMKIKDDTERQRAIAENHELFGF